jgi:16S rRNA (guanine527-N7)-methyltransferase
MPGSSSSIVSGAIIGSIYGPEPGPWPSETMSQLERYISELLRWNRAMHIVGRADVALNLTKQLGDSIGLLLFADSCVGGTETKWSRIADIGSGAGFPGLVWKILRPHLEIALFERRERMATLLMNISSRLGIKDLEIVQADAAEYEPKHSFDLVVSKAAGSFGKLVPVAEGLLRMGGSYCTVKGAGTWREELGEPGADRLTLEHNVPARAGSGQLFWFSRESGTGGGP